MIRKSQKGFPISHHRHVAKKLARLDGELREVLGTLRTEKSKDAALKCEFWLSRLRATLDNQLLRDFPAEHSPSVYFPGSPEPTSATETPAAPESTPVAKTETATTPEPMGETPVERVVLTERV